MLVVIVGDLGSGKTLLATLIAAHDDRPVYANYAMRLDNDRYHQLEPQMLEKLNTPSLIVLDEAYLYLESRLSGRDLNLYMDYILLQSRKRKMDFVLTTQMVSALDKRFRNLADVLIIAERTKEGFAYHLIFPGKGGNKTFTMTWSTAQKYFPLYDTYEVISPIDDSMRFNIIPNKADLIPELDKIIEDMLTEHDEKHWTKGMVEDYTLEHMLPFAYSRMLYNRIKRQASDEVEDDAA